MADESSTSFLTTTRAILRASKPICARILPTIAESFELLNDYLSAGVGSLSALCNLEGLHDAYQDERPRKQRKMKMVTQALGFLLNTAYTVCAYLGKYLSNVGLGFLALASNTITLTCSLYVAHQTRGALLEIEQEIENSRKEHPNTDGPLHTLIERRQQYFKSKVDLVYNTAIVLATGCFTAGIFYTPLIFVGIGILSLQTLFELYDRNTRFKFSRWISGNQDFNVSASDFTRNAGNTHEIQKTLGYPAESLSQEKTNQSEDTYDLLPQDDIKKPLAFFDTQRTAQNILPSITPSPTAYNKP